jgi:aminoglycoside 3-N-acetyltransferase
VLALLANAPLEDNNVGQHERRLMSEADAIADAASPVTMAEITEALIQLGLRQRDFILVHSSSSSLGWVCGGAVAVVEALLAALGPSGRS